MAGLKDKLVRRMIGDSDPWRAGYTLAMRGLRRGDRRELYLGLVLSGLAYLRRTKPTKTLVYRQELKEGSALLIRNAKPGQPKAEVVNPKP